MSSVLSILLLALAAIASAARLVVSIPPSQLLPNPSTLPSSTHAVLLGPPGVRYDVKIRRDNTFVFSDIPDASYLLTLHSRDYFFPPLRVDVKQSEGESAPTISAWQTFRGNEWNNKGSSYGTGKEELSIQVKPVGQKDFYQVRGGFNLIGFLKSPMILMALVSVVMIFGLPYVMENSASQSENAWSTSNLLQWTRRLKRNSRRCRRSLQSWARRVPRILCRTSTWLGSCQAVAKQRRPALLEEAAKDSQSTITVR